VRLARGLALASLVLALISLALPAIEGSGFPTQSGMDVLRQGASAWRNGVVAWYANPALVVAVGLCLIGWYRMSLGIALLALALAVSSFSAAPVAESFGRSVPAFGFGIGFYVWLAAFVLAVVAAAAGYIRCRNADRAAGAAAPHGPRD